MIALTFLICWLFLFSAMALGELVLFAELRLKRP